MSEEPVESGGEARNNASTTHVVGRPFPPGNPGRPKGSRHKAAIAIEASLQGQAEGLTQKAIEKALGGDNFALKLCLDRLAPPRKQRGALSYVGLDVHKAKIAVAVADGGRSGRGSAIDSRVEPL